MSVNHEGKTRARQQERARLGNFGSCWYEQVVDPHHVVGDLGYVHSKGRYRNRRPEIRKAEERDASVRTIRAGDQEVLSGSIVEQQADSAQSCARPGEEHSVISVGA